MGTSAKDDSPSPSPSPSLPISLSPSASTTSLLRRVGSVKRQSNKLTHRLGELRMSDAAKARARSVSNPQATSASSSHPPTPRSFDVRTLNIPSSSAHRQDLPPWDRTLDAVYHKHAHNRVKDGIFHDTLTQFFKDHCREKPQTGYFRLPDTVRFRICQFLLPSANKPLTLNESTFSRDVWRTRDFSHPSCTLLPLAPYLDVSFAFRADMLVAFLLATTLHAVFSPYVGPKLNPLATTWLNKYGPYAQNLVIEIDMTRLGCGPEPGATGLLPNVEHTEELLHKFVDSQIRRSGSCPLQSLVLLCRRFHGRRTTLQARSITGRSSGASNYSRWSQKSERACSSEDMRLRSPGLKEANMSADRLLRQIDLISSVDDSDPLMSPGLQLDIMSPSLPSPLPAQDYCPDSYLVICNHILRLRGRLNSIRMCGFSESYTASFINTLFPDAKNDPGRHAYRVAPSTIWPKLSGQRSYVDIGDGYIALDEQDGPRLTDLSLALRRWEGCVQLPPPLLDAEGKPSLPPIVSDLQRVLNPVARTGTSLSERTCEQIRKEVDEGSVDKKRVMRFIDKYGKGKGKKKRRVLTRDAATTL
ncbi:hypothetical protein FZEAL_6315 [Fusarium zealandicum]|uniref:Uncharacterized protein n=1 Tax=Fusarium zealandicum TaxID=1053134 RepID=A0A8H4XJR7_9HYPO|nr:hypothetical protein FZEAL_6315 [Fusarium zealandicum]